jgi:hypothetical protein
MTTKRTTVNVSNGGDDDDDDDDGDKIRYLFVCWLNTHGH